MCVIMVMIIVIIINTTFILMVLEWGMPVTGRQQILIIMISHDFSWFLVASWFDYHWKPTPSWWLSHWKSANGFVTPPLLQSRDPVMDLSHQYCNPVIVLTIRIVVTGRDLMDLLHQYVAIPWLIRVWPAGWLNALQRSSTYVSKNECCHFWSFEFALNELHCNGHWNLVSVDFTEKWKQPWSSQRWMQRIKVECSVV